MKKLLFSLMGLTFCGFMAQAQVSGNITGTVVDATQQPVEGVAVFTSTKASWVYHDYTDANGDYTIYYSGAQPGDTLEVWTVDCQGAKVSQWASAGGPATVNTIQISCVPGPCDAYTFVDSANGSHYTFTAIALRDSAAANMSSSATHYWTFTGMPGRSGRLNAGPNLDTIVFRKSALPTDFEFCYERTTSCTPVCDTVGVIAPPPPPVPFCDAHFYVDSVNSVNFLGEVILWENSSTDSGSINDYHWSFGDGNTSNAQYPTHTYSDTGIYEVCLEITAVDGGDTCVSTYCDSIGFDSNGNLVYKSTQQGFTINVVDPATVGQNEEVLQSHFSLFPNPSTDAATLDWNESVRVERIDVISMSGQLVQSIEPEDSFVRFSSLKGGAYMLRVKSDQGTTTMKMIVQ